MTRPDDEELVITSNGVQVGGWTSFRVTRGVERLPSDFVVQLTERYPGQMAEVPLLPGAYCQVSVTGPAGTDLLLTGYIDVYGPQYDKDNHTVAIGGRSLCEDLVDSSIDGDKLGGWVLQAATAGEAAVKLAQLFGIGVSLPDGDFPVPMPQTFPINPGVAGYVLLEEVCRTAGCLLWDDAGGNLVLSKLGTARAGSALVEGQNIERARATHRMDQRYSDYIVIGLGYDNAQGTHLSVKATAHDSEVQAQGRYRSLIIPWEGPDQLDQAGNTYSQRRADWQAARRYGRGHTAQLTVTGWRDGAGALWQPNTIVAVECPQLKIGRDMAIAEVSWIRSAGEGTQTLLTVMPSEGLQPQPLSINLLPFMNDPSVAGAAPTQSPG